MAKRQPRPPRKLRGLRLWFARLFLMVGLPLLFLTGIEVVLRVAGFGFAPDFLVPDATAKGGHLQRAKAESAYRSNPTFPWRFFPPRLARVPENLRLYEPKEVKGHRIFVLGGSAAQGVPTPDYGLARMLQAMLEIAYPEERFEVINCALTAINSHVVREIVEDTLAHDPDCWVVYLGNNEVVGPFGPGGLGQGDVLPLPVIRFLLKARELRLGQAALSLGGAFGSDAHGSRGWEGMAHFVDRPVPYDSPALVSMTDHFRENLQAIVDMGMNNQIPVVLSTVMVNLSDQPPFRSVLPRLEAADLQDLHEQLNMAEALLGYAMTEPVHVDRAEVLAEKGSRAARALDVIEGALKLAPQHARLFYLQGHAYARLGETAKARMSWSRARDYDSLRFRTDSRLNQAIREVALANREVRLVDSAREVGNAPLELGVERSLAADEKFFFEHVHLTFEGNWQLAASLFPRVVESLSLRDSQAPSQEAVARRLAFGKDAEALQWESILGLIDRPPFTFLAEFPELRAHAQRKLRLANSAVYQDPQGTLQTWAEAIKMAPEDPFLHRRYAEAVLRLGDENGIEMASESLDIARQGFSNDADLRQIEALLQLQKGDLRQALRELRRAATERPWDPNITINLVQLLSELEWITEARDLLEEALLKFPGSARLLFESGKLYQREGLHGPAEGAYRAALRANPRFAPALNALLTIYAREDRSDDEEAILHEVTAIPLSGYAHGAKAMLLWRQGRSGEARQAATKALKDDPALSEIRFRLAADLLRQGQVEAALKEFETVIKWDPHHVGALNDLAWYLCDGKPPDDAFRSLDLAELAAKLTGYQQPSILSTLAQAQQANGRSQDALATLDTAIGLAQAQPTQEALVQRLQARRDALAHRLMPALEEQ